MDYKKDSRVATLVFYIILMVFLFTYLLTYPFGLGPQYAEQNAWGWGYMVMISILFGLIHNDIIRKKYAKFPISLWTIAHFSVPVFIELLLYGYFQNIEIAFYGALIFTTLFELFEYFLRVAGIQKNFSIESKINTIFDFITHIIASYIALIWLT